MRRKPTTKTKIDVHASLYCESVKGVIRRGSQDVEVFEWEAEPWLKAGWATLSSEREEVTPNAFGIAATPGASAAQDDDEHEGPDDRHLGYNPAGGVGDQPA